MFYESLKQFKISILFLIVFSLLTGLIYPLVITAIAQVIFPWKANGSLVEVNNRAIGSALIGQSFTDPKYFWGRPSATAPFPYNGANSSGSNMGPSNPAFLKTVQNRVALLKQVDPTNLELVPVDLVTASGSGLDPDVSPWAAYYQVPRVAKANQLPEQAVHDLVAKLVRMPTFHLFGTYRVNVLALNLALEELKKPHP